MMNELPEALHRARTEVSQFVGALPENIGFVTNATEGVNVVLRSLRLKPKDELLTTDHAYPACKNALAFVADRSGIDIRVARVPFPLSSPAEVVESVVAAVTARTRLALLDHVTSATGLVFPLEELVRELRERGVQVLVDGAHAPGMLDLDIEAIGADYYAANFHKWCCAPKGAGFVWVRPELQEDIAPLVVSHGYARPAAERFRAMFDWTGTQDPSAWLCLPEALSFMASLVEGGWPELRAKNRALALFARNTLCEALGIDPPAPDSMLGSLAAVPLPASKTPSDGMIDPLHAALVERGFETLAVYWPKKPERVLRVSAQLYNRPDEYEELARVLPGLL